MLWIFPVCFQSFPPPLSPNLQNISKTSYNKIRNISEKIYRSLQHKLDIVSLFLESGHQ